MLISHTIVSKIVVPAPKGVAALTTCSATVHSVYCQLNVHVLITTLVSLHDLTNHGYEVVLSTLVSITP